MAAVAVNPLHEAHTLEPSENWDDDFEFGQGNGRASTSSNRKNHTRTRPSNDTQRRPSSTTNGRTFSMASSTMEDWDLPDTPDTNHHPSTVAVHTENWDDDFEVETRNNSPRKPKVSTPRRRDVREESWDDELDLEAKRDELDSEFGRRDEEDRTVTARSRRAALSRFASANPSPPPPMPFFPPNHQHPSPEPFPRSPTASVFSVPNTIHTYSSSTPLVYGGNPRPLSGFALLPPSPPIHKERERRRLRKKSRPLPEGRIELVDMVGRYSFSDSEGPAKKGRSATPMSDVSSVDERHHHHVLEPTPPLPTLPSVSAMPSAPVTTASGSTTTMPATPTKGGATLLSRIGSVKKWGVMRRRGTSSTPLDVIATESQSHDNPDRTPRPKTSMSSFTPEPSTSSSYPSTPNGTSSVADTQHTHTHWFFRASSGTGSPGASSSARPGSSGRDSVGHNKQRRSTSRSRTRERGGDRDAGDTHVGARGASSSRPPPVVTGNGGGDWNASRTSLRLAVGLQRESVMENSPSPSRPSSPLPSMQGVSARKARVSYSGRRPSLSGANPQAAEKTQMPVTPSKLVKRKSLGFVRLGFGGGNAHATEEKPAHAGKYPSLGLGLGRRPADSDDEEDYGDQQLQQRTRRKSFSRLLLDRDKSKDRDDHETPTKEGSRGFMGSVRRISLVGRHKRAQSGGGFGVVPSSPGPSGGGFFNRNGGGSKGAVPPPLPYSLPPLPNSGSQLSLRLPEASGSTYSLHQQPLNHPNLHLTSRRIISASSGRSEASSVFPSSTVSGGSGSAAGSHSRSTGVGLDGGVQRTPSGKVRQRSKSRTRKSEDERRGQPEQGGGSSSTARRPSVTTKTDRRSVDLVFDSVGTNHQQVLLPPIELQPPSPPRTLAQSAVEPTMATPKAKIKEPTNNAAKSNTRFLASALTAFDMHTLSPGTLSPAFSAVPSSPLSVSALAPPRTPQPTSPSTSSSSFFTPTGSPYPPASPNKLVVGGVGHSPGKQSTSLGRATAGGVVGVDGSSGGGKGVGVGGSAGGTSGSGAGGSVPRRNSLGDLKIPARISQAQVGLRRDLGMVREFAMNIEQLKDLQQTYQALVLDVQGIIESHLHLPQSSPATTVPQTTSTSTGFFSNLKVKTRGRSNTNPTANEVAQREQQMQAQREQRTSRCKELASSFYTLNSKYRISWECAELLIELAGGGGDGGASTTASWGVVSAPPLELSLPHPSEIMGGAGAADSGIGKKRSRERAITLAGDEAKPTPSTSSIPAALSASSSSMPAASNTNNSWRASTGRHDLSHRQLGLLREMLNNANATVDVTPVDVEAEVEDLVASNVNKEWRWGDARNSTITLPEEEQGQQRGGKRRSGRMSGIRDMLRALKKGAAAPSSPPIVDAAEQHHHHLQHQQPPVPLLSPEIFQSTTSLSTESSAGSRRRYPNLLPRIPNARRVNKSSTGPESVRSASKSKTRPPEGVYPASFSAPKPSPRRPSLASIFRNIGGSKRPVSVSVDDPIVLSSATTAGDPEACSATGDSSSNTGEEEDWDRMDSASDLDAAANALQDGVGTVRGRGIRKLSKNRKGKSPYLQDPHVPSVRPAIVQKRSFNGSQTSLQQQQGSPTGNFGGQAQLVRPLRLSNVDETDYPHSPVLPTTTSRPSSRVSGKFGSPTLHPQSSSLRAKPPHLLATSATMPILSASASPPAQGPSSSMTMPVISSPASGIATSAAAGDWKLAMTPENIRPLLENAREVHARLCDCVEELGRLREIVVVC